MVWVCLFVYLVKKTAYTKNMAIRISDPVDRPFGALSPSTYQPFYIDGETYNTVLNYTYSSILKYPGNRSLLMNASPKDIYDLYDKTSKIEVGRCQQEAASAAYRPKILSNEELKTLLLDTGTRKIIYMSLNPYLGINPTTNEGTNTIGNILMAIRHDLHVEKRELLQTDATQKHDENLYKSYLIYTGLLSRIRSGDNLMNYLGLNTEQLITILGNDIRKYENIEANSPEEALAKRSPPKSTIVMMKNAKQLEHVIEDGIYAPELLVRSVRKDGLGHLRTRLLKERSRIIFDCFVDYVLEKSYPNVRNEQYEAARRQTFRSLQAKELDALIETTVEQYNQGMISERLSRCIDNKIERIRPPSLEDIQSAEEFDVSYQGERAIANTKIYVTDGNNNPIELWKDPNDRMDPSYYPLLPTVNTGIITVNDYRFPDVSTYILFQSLIYHAGPSSSFPLSNSSPSRISTEVGKIYNTLILADESPDHFLPIEELNHAYPRLVQQWINQRSRDSATRAMDVMFRNQNTQDLLLSTGEQPIEYIVKCRFIDGGNVDDNSCDLFLGVAYVRRHNQHIPHGSNVIGQYLSIIRDRVKDQRKDIHLEKLTIDDITDLLRASPFLDSWMKMKVKDMCLTILKLWHYHQSANITTRNRSILEDPDDIPPGIIRQALDKIYQPCSQISGNISRINIESPAYFTSLINSRTGFEGVGFDGIDAIWKRTAVMIYFIIHQMRKTSMVGIISIIAGAESLNSSEIAQDCPNLATTDVERCIVAAILNILDGIMRFNTATARGTTEIDAKAVNVAISIILDNPDTTFNYFSARKEQVTRDMTNPSEELIQESRMVQENSDDLGTSDEMGPRRSILRPELERILERNSVPKDNLNILLDTIDRAVVIIRDDRKMSLRTKTNRINFFFCTSRSIKLIMRI